MKFLILFLFIFFFKPYLTLSQDSCSIELEKKYKKSIKSNYNKIDCFSQNILPGSSISIKIKKLKFKQRIIFIFHTKKLGDTIEVSILALNGLEIDRKIINNKNCFFRIPQIKKSGDYFMIIKTKNPKSEECFENLGCLSFILYEIVPKY